MTKCKDKKNKDKVKGEAVFVIPLHIFKIDVAVFDNIADHKLAMKKHNIPDWDYEEIPCTGSAHYMKDKDGFPYYSMVISKNSSVGTWAHEACHIADFIMEHVGIPFNADNTEIRAYMVGFMVDIIRDCHDKLRY